MKLLGLFVVGVVALFAVFFMLFSIGVFDSGITGRVVSSCPVFSSDSDASFFVKGSSIVSGCSPASVSDFCLNPCVVGEYANSNLVYFNCTNGCVNGACLQSASNPSLAQYCADKVGPQNIEDCDNGFDDDNDGLTDCEDVIDCENAANCVPQEYCGDMQCNGAETCSSCPEDCGVCPAIGCTHYASPTGGGNGLSQSSPFKIANFWSIPNIAGKKLCLLDGTYQGVDSMIKPPEGLSGTSGYPITVSALHDGDVLISGVGVPTSPIRLEYNDWFVLEGFNACCGSSHDATAKESVVFVGVSDNVIVRRVVGWDAADGNTLIFGASYSRNVLFEDVAGFGIARKIIASGNSGDKSAPSTNITVRRVFARLEKNTWGGQTAISTDYDSSDNIMENAIATVDGNLEDMSHVGASYVDVIDSDRPYDRNNQLLGSIFYRIEGQSLTGSPLANMVNIDGNEYKARDILSYVGGSESTYGEMWNNLGFNYQRDPSTQGVSESSDSDVRYLTLIGGPGSRFKRLIGSTVSHIIATDVNWHGSNDPSQNNDDYAIYIPYNWPGWSDYGRAPDYVMAYNNIKNWNNVPAHYNISDPDLIGRCGNLLQYGCNDSMRPKVSGQSVGAQIQCRYENGVLTNKSLWPWPMDERIRIATCMYDNPGLSKDDCKSRPDLGVDVTKTVFELGGGTVPDFAEINPIVCPG